MKTYSEKIKAVKAAIAEADAIIIGAGAGLSTAAGYTYSGERFERYFFDFKEKYGFSDMYSGGFYPYKTPEEMWAFWSRYIYINRYMPIPKDTYSKLFNLVIEKDYFVITTNVDHCFQRAGFDKKRLFYTQGDYGLFQCSVPCHHKTYDNEEIIKQMYEQQKDMKIPTALIPKCPVCGEPMTMNLRSDDKFVEDDGWKKAYQHYVEFTELHKKGKVIYLELGVGYNTPVIIKYPFWQRTAENENATYVCINFDDADCPKEIEKQAICITGDADKIINDLSSDY
jgi:NAD-dependent SIR2 family protein deacetylase